MMMDKRALRAMILNECGCMAREGELPNAIAAVMPMLDVLGYGHTDGAHPMMASDGSMTFEDSDENEESSMIRSNLHNLAMQSKMLRDMVQDGDDLPEWVQEKIAVASDMIDTIYDYINGELGDEGLYEARKPWYMKKRRNMKKTNESEWYDVPRKKIRPLKKKR
jgi:hypothetical protein